MASLQSIRAYKMRAFLTILGVVMGIMTVTGMSFDRGRPQRQRRGVGREDRLLHDLHPAFALGEQVDDDEWQWRKAITLDEVDAIAKKPSVAAICPIQIVGVESVKYGTERAQDVQVLGTTPEYEAVHESYL
ncbi:MAG: hypothetical protein U0599_28010 [Vicinamibacteria bacterium]